jgi:hypothetical protein
MVCAWLPQTWQHLLSAKSRFALAPHRRGSVRLVMEILEDRLTPTGNIAITNVILVIVST